MQNSGKSGRENAKLRLAAGRRGRDAPPLWDSYNVVVVFISKTYARAGTSSWENAGARHEQEQLMLDIVMLALAAGFFAAGAGYAYVCERL
ncbi:MAG TPA: hypothetical protein VJS63_05130 [Bradyrhizobium sp.]|nr:hypothetical protein [Bradyrhizobium sp.]